MPADMPIEVIFLVLTLYLYAAMIIVQAVLSNGEHTPKQLLGSRDGLQETSVYLGRARRANANMVEALLLFVPAALLVLVLGRSNSWTELGALIFFLSRLTFAPLYWFGVPVLRTLAWFGGLCGIIMVYTQLWPLTAV